MFDVNSTRQREFIEDIINKLVALIGWQWAVQPAQYFIILLRSMCVWGVESRKCSQGFEEITQSKQIDVMESDLGMRVNLSIRILLQKMLKMLRHLRYSTYFISENDERNFVN